MSETENKTEFMKIVDEHSLIKKIVSNMEINIAEWDVEKLDWLFNTLAKRTVSVPVIAIIKACEDCEGYYGTKTIYYSLYKLLKESLKNNVSSEYQTIVYTVLQLCTAMILPMDKIMEGVERSKEEYDSDD